MGFDKGKMNFSAIVLPEKQDTQFETSLLQESYKPTKPSLESPVEDFTAGHSLAGLGRQATPEDFAEDGTLYFCCRQRELKINAQEYRERVQLRIKEFRNRNGSLKREDVKQIQEEVRLALETSATEKVTGTRCVLAESRNILLVEAVTTKSVDDVVTFIEGDIVLTPVGTPGKVWSPEYLYERWAGKKANVYVSIPIKGMRCVTGMGPDFLTWMFMASESEGLLPEGIKCGITGDMQMTDCREVATGAENISLKKGQPPNGREVITCLEQGKKLVSAEFAFDFDGTGMVATLDSKLAVRKLGFMKGAVQGGMGERVIAAQLLMSGIEKIFKAFINSEPANAELINNWISAKKEYVAAQKV